MRIDLVMTFLGAAAGGVVLGLLYFGGLWWTVRRSRTARHPAPLVIGSFLIRTTVATAGIVIVSAARPIPLMVAMVGFLVARMVMIRVVGAADLRTGGQQDNPPL